MSTLIDRLNRYVENRGMMANLRCLLVENKKHRAWPVLSRLGIDIKDSVLSTVAGLYATHPVNTETGNFGTTCKSIESKRNENQSGNDDKLTPTERRFQHLLAAEPGQELFKRITRMVLMAASQNVPVNYTQLEKDLKFWNDRTKAEWASEYWTPGVLNNTEEIDA
ncbi:MAG TPA: type I-E CRISPR-associated protein Cse2/CasB [Chitinispirillaceae bacterium]|nr:type I-E CRISPR-associated protein Cse2/CasB [Chitinispirillaceae bacterium]